MDTAPGDPEQPLRIFFNPDSGRAVVYGAGAIAFFMILYGFINTDAFLMLTSLVPMAVSAYHLPAMHNEKPQIEVFDQGLYLDGLGVIPWEAVVDIEILDPESGETTIPELIVETRDSIEAVIDPQRGLTLMRTFQIMVWRLEELNLLRVKLHQLNVDPDFLGADIRRRLRQSRTRVF